MAPHQGRPPRQPLLTRALAVAAAGVLASLGAGRPGPAYATPQDPVPPRKDLYGYGFGANDPARPSRGRTGGPSSGQPSSGSGGSSSTPNQCGGFRFGVQLCDFARGPATTPARRARPTMTPAQLAQQQWRRLPIPAPSVRTAPPRGSDGLVGLAEWFWVTNWSARTARAQAGGVWVEVTARPTDLTIRPGRGLAPVPCGGPGTPYDTRRPTAEQRSDCTYTYTRSSAGMPGSAYQVTVTVTWGGVWSGSGGAGGTLPALSRSTTFPVRIAEGQALTGGLA